MPSSCCWILHRFLVYEEKIQEKARENRGKGVKSINPKISMQLLCYEHSTDKFLHKLKKTKEPPFCYIEGYSSLYRAIYVKHPNHQTVLH
jgi:hypothetical protein